MMGVAKKATNSGWGVVLGIQLVLSEVL